MIFWACSGLMRWGSCTKAAKLSRFLPDLPRFFRGTGHLSGLKGRNIKAQVAGLGLEIQKSSSGLKVRERAVSLFYTPTEGYQTRDDSKITLAAKRHKTRKKEEGLTVRSQRCRCLSRIRAGNQYGIPVL